jgi:hypothetical protein
VTRIGAWQKSGVGLALAKRNGQNDLENTGNQKKKGIEKAMASLLKMGYPNRNHVAHHVS